MGKLQLNTDPGNPGVSLTWGEREKEKTYGTMGTGLENLSHGNKMYDDLFKANPYTNLTYNKSSWQDFLSRLGFRTDYDRWLEDAQVNKAEYDAQVQSIIQQNEYNSPSAQAERMRQAGMNPDLLGTQGVSDSASPTQDVNGMMQNAGDEFGQAFEKVQNFASTIMSMFQMGTGLAKDFMTFKQMQQGIAGQDVDLAKSFMDFADNYVLKSAPTEPFSNDREYRDYLDKIGKDLVFNIPKQLHLSRRQRSIWNEVVSPTYFNSESFKNMTGNWLQTRKNLDETAKTKSYSVSKPIIGQDNWNAFNIVADNLGELANEVWKLEKKRFKAVSNKDISQAEAEQQIFDAQQQYRDGQTGMNYGQWKVSSEAEGYKTSYYTRSVEKAMNRALQKITTELENQANNGDLLSAGLLLSFNIFRLSNFGIK